MKKNILRNLVGKLAVLYEIDENNLFTFDEHGKEKYFKKRIDAINYMAKTHHWWKRYKSIGYCRRCGGPLFKSVFREHGYAYQCFECDEDFYPFEQEPIAKKPHNNAVFK